MLNTPATGRNIATKTLLFLVLATVLWTALLIIGATQMRNIGLESASYDVKIGPLLLNQLARTATASGNIVSFSFENGLVAYFGAWLFCGLCIGCFTGNSKKASSWQNPPD